jgi:hypothetical protein
MDPEACQSSEAELELARRVRDEHIYDVDVDPGMLNQIFRHGLMFKKSRDGDDRWRVRRSRSRKHYREYDRVDGSPCGTCPTGTTGVTGIGARTLLYSTATLTLRRKVLLIFRS